MLPFGPHWFTWVMGTGIVAVALASAPFPVPGGEVLALGFWLLAAVMLAAVTAGTVRRWRADRGLVGRELDDPVVSHFYGAKAMALMMVGTGALVAGQPLLGLHVALAVDAVLWTAGTLLGLLTTVLVPYRAITTHETADDSASPGWLLPVVPPVVSASTGPLLLPHLPEGEARASLLLLCYACFGVTLVAGLLVTTAVWQRLVRHGVGDPATVPAVFIVLGFLGTSVTAASHLADVVPLVWPDLAHAFAAFAVVYGIPVWGFALAWLALASALVLRTARSGLPFTPSWWAFTFPVGTVVTGTAVLAERTDLLVLHGLTGLLLAALVGLWALVAGRTAARLLPRNPRVAVPGLEGWSSTSQG